MTSVVPQPDHRFGQVVFIAQHTHARCAQQEKPAGRRFKAEPTGGEHPKKMAARKKQHIALDRAQPAHDTISTRAHLGRRFPSRATVPEQLPVRPFHVDLRRAAALIIAVVPFKQIAINLGYRPETRQFASSYSSLQRAGKHLGEAQSTKPMSKLAGVTFAAL